MVKNGTDEKMVLCFNENKCDTYIRNYNPRGKSGRIFYQEFIEEFTSTGRSNKRNFPFRLRNGTKSEL
jgi:hypothetical protein